MFLCTENIGNHVSAYRHPVGDWLEFLQALAYLKNNKDELPYKTIVIDTMTFLMAMCREFVLRKNNMVHESDEGFGKGWALVTEEMQRVLLKLSAMYPLVLLCHTELKEISLDGGRKLTQFTPDMQKGTVKVVTRLAGMLLYVERCSDSEGAERVCVHTSPSKNIMAKQRTPNGKHMPDVIWTPDKGEAEALYTVLKDEYAKCFKPSSEAQEQPEG